VHLKEAYRQWSDLYNEAESDERSILVDESPYLEKSKS